MYSVIFLFGLVSFSLFISGFFQSKYRNNSYGSFWPMNIIGAFVWGDAVVFGLFWTLVSLYILVTKEIALFPFVISLFWTIRSFGEVQYWLNHQFTEKEKNKLSSFPRLKSIFHNDSVWFVYQIYWQCVMVICVLASLYFGKIWMASL